MNGISEIRRKLEGVFARTPPMPEPHHNCQWCHDSGWVECYQQNGKNYPMRFADTFLIRREKRGSYFVGAPCGFCEAGTYRGRPTEGSLKGAERWVKENVTSLVSLSGAYKKAEEEGFDSDTIDQAFKRLGIRKFKHANRWMGEPAA